MSEEQHWYMPKEAATAMAAELKQTHQKLAEAQADCATKVNALRQADDWLHRICGADMALAHGGSETEVWRAITEMRPVMNAVKAALASNAGDALVKELEDKTELRVLQVIEREMRLIAPQMKPVNLETGLDLIPAFADALAKDLRAQRDQAVLLARELGEVLKGSKSAMNNLAEMWSAEERGHDITSDKYDKKVQEWESKRTAALAKLAALNPPTSDDTLKV